MSVSNKSEEKGENISLVNSNAEEKTEDSKLRWYALKVSSGSENSVKTAILEHSSEIDVLVPELEAIATDHNVGVAKKKKLIPGYLFLRLEMTDENYSKIKSIPKVLDFMVNTGPNKSPHPIPKEQINSLISQIQKKSDESWSACRYSEGHDVEIIDGPFKGFVGVINAVDNELSILKVSVVILGRATPIELNFAQVKRNI